MKSHRNSEIKNIFIISFIYLALPIIQTHLTYKTHADHKNITDFPRVPMTSQILHKDS